MSRDDASAELAADAAGRIGTRTPLAPALDVGQARYRAMTICIVSRCWPCFHGSGVNDNRCIGAMMFVTPKR
jgi:hypothetical protein